MCCRTGAECDGGVCCVAGLVRGVMEGCVVMQDLYGMCWRGVLDCKSDAGCDGGVCCVAGLIWDVMEECDVLQDRCGM